MQSSSAAACVLTGTFLILIRLGSLSVFLFANITEEPGETEREGEI